MSHEPTLTLELQDHPVTLHHPGAEGVRFHDAVFVIRNEGSAPAEHIRLGLRIVQGSNVLADAVVDPTPVGMPATLSSGEAGRASLFRLLQQEVKGFGSKVNLFGYKAVLNWTYEVSATAVMKGQAPAAEGRTWQVCWRPSEATEDLVEVDIAG